MSDDLFEKLDEIIWNLRRRAIDAYMKERDFRANEVFGVYEYTGFSPLAFESKISLPGSNGLDGGRQINPVSLDTFDYQTAFQNVVQRVDNAISKWFSLPDPKDLDAPIGVCRDLYGALAKKVVHGSPEPGKKKPVSVGPVAEDLDKAVKRSKTLSGKAMLNFRKNFLDKIQPTMNALCGVACVIEGNLAAEKAALGEVRKAVPQVAMQAAGAFAHYAESPGASERIGRLLIDIGAAALGAAAVVASGGGALVVGVGLASLGVDLAGKVVKTTREIVEDTSSYESIMSNFENALKFINDDFSRVEHEIILNLVNNHRHMEENHQFFDLELYPLHYEDVDEQDRASGQSRPASETELRIPNMTKANEIAKKILPAVSRSLGEEASKLNTFSLALNRDSNVGYSSQGPSDILYGVKDLLFRLVRELGEDVDLGAHNLKLVIDVFRDVDEATAQAMNAQVSNLDSVGKTTDPWDG